MSRLDRDVLQDTLDEVATWMRHTTALMGWRTRILLEAQEAGRRLSSKVIDLRQSPTAGQYEPGPSTPEDTRPSPLWLALPLTRRWQVPWTDRCSGR